MNWVGFFRKVKRLGSGEAVLVGYFDLDFEISHDDFRFQFCDLNLRSYCNKGMMTTTTSGKGALTEYFSYPREDDEEERFHYEGDKWKGQFAGVNGKKSEEWVQRHAIIAFYDCKYPSEDYWRTHYCGKRIVITKPCCRGKAVHNIVAEILDIHGGEPKVCRDRNTRYLLDVEHYTRLNANVCKECVDGLADFTIEPKTFIEQVEQVLLPALLPSSLSSILNVIEQDDGNSPDEYIEGLIRNAFVQRGSLSTEKFAEKIDNALEKSNIESEQASRLSNYAHHM